MLKQIPTSFTIPKGYRREFLLKVSSCRASFKIIASPKGIELDSEVPENVRWVDMCRVLDWVEESMMSVRKEVGADL